MLSMRRILVSAGLLLGLTLAGVFGYRLIEGASWVDAFYMTVITLSTVGYGEVFPLSPMGRIFTAGLIVVGIGLVFGITGTWVRSLIGGELEELLIRRRMTRVISSMKGHFIVCGYGRFGRTVSHELQVRGEQFVVIDDSADVPANIVSLRADATDEEVLVEAGLPRARALLAALPSDADNLYITLTSRELAPDIFIVSRCSQESSEARLSRAGASRVVAPYSISGHRMVELALNPGMISVGDIVTGAGGSHLNVAEVAISRGSVLDGGSLGGSRIAQRYGVIPVGVLDAGGRIQVGSKPERILQAGEILVVFGTEHSVEKFVAALGGTDPESVDRIAAGD